MKELIKEEKFFIIVMLLVLVFLGGMRAGEYHTLKHQKIQKSATGYLVDYDGNYYEYTED